MQLWDHLTATTVPQGITSEVEWIAQELDILEPKALLGKGPKLGDAVSQVCVIVVSAKPGPLRSMRAASIHCKARAPIHRFLARKKALPYPSSRKHSLKRISCEHCRSVSTRHEVGLCRQSGGSLAATILCDRFVERHERRYSCLIRTV